MHTRQVSCYLYQYTRIFKTFQLPHIFFWKEFIYACSRYCAKITHVHIQGILLPKITYAHLKYFISIQNFCCFIHIYLYIYAHWSPSHVMHTLAFTWKGIFMPSIYTWKAIPHHIFILGKHFRATSNMCTFKKRLTTYSTCTRFNWRVFFSCYLFYIYMHMVNNIFIQTRKTSWCSPNKSAAALKGNPYFNPFLFMFSCTKNQRLGFLVLSP